MTVWTAVPDQDRGWPRQMDLDLARSVAIARKVTAR
jgi:hypothetical protein